MYMSVKYEPIINFFLHVAIYNIFPQLTTSKEYYQNNDFN